MNVLPLPTQLKCGPYQGNCTNTTGTKPVISRLTLTVIRQENQAIHGMIATTGALKVKQDFTAIITGNQLHFVTSAPNKKLTIEWHAAIQDGVIRGTFSATQTGLWVSFFGKKSQNGEWQCTKERFPIVRHLKSFAKGVIGVGVLLAVFGGVIALINSDTASTSPGIAYAPIPDSAPALSYPYEDTRSSTPYEALAPPSTTSRSSTGGYTPRISDRAIAEVGSKVYDAVLDDKRVDVKGYMRDGTYVRPHDRQPPGGFTASDKVEAGAGALGVALFIKAADYVDQKYDPEKIAARKKAEEQQQAESQRRLREDAERRQQQNKKPWWKR